MTRLRLVPALVEVALDDPQDSPLLVDLPAIPGGVTLLDVFGEPTPEEVAEREARRASALAKLAAAEEWHRLRPV